MPYAGFSAGPDLKGPIVSVVHRCAEANASPGYIPYHQPTIYRDWRHDAGHACASGRVAWVRATITNVHRFSPGWSAQQHPPVSVRPHHGHAVSIPESHPEPPRDSNTNCRCGTEPGVFVNSARKGRVASLQAMECHSDCRWSAAIFQCFQGMRCNSYCRQASGYDRKGRTVETVNHATG